jgi:transcriptional regulator with XRE-family HTH domain
MKDQIIEIMNYYGISATRFADEIGVQRSSISHILSGRNKPSFDFIAKLIEKYPAVNTSWLLTGKGNMLEDKSTREILDQKQPDLFTNSPDNIPNNQEPPGKVEGNEKINNQIHISKQTEVVTNEKSIDFILLMYTDGTFVRYVKGN